MSDLETETRFQSDPALEPLLADLASTAARRDTEGGTAKRERDLIRESGLLSLAIPRALGGAGADWIEIVQAVQRMAAVDSSLAHLFAFHHLMVVTPQIFGTAEQSRALMEKTARERCFWGNAVNPKDPRLRLSRDGAILRLDGAKTFCSGASDSDMLIVSALDEEDRLKIAAIPTRRAGLRIHDDWDNMGQRQTDSGSVSFERVELREDELLVAPGPLGSPFAALRPCLVQLLLVAIFAGLARGALDEAKAYVRGLPSEGAARIGADAFILHTAGELWTQAAAVEALLDRATRAFQSGWERGDSITPRERGAIAIEIATAKAVSARASLDIGSRIFEIMGARATHARLRLDRFWRNARTHTLHDPIDHKLKEIGDFVLNDAYPTPSFYS
ncbi:acyl-CoA dehydrogenase family protein [Methylosinus sp. H3A]|uniref:acyl-CoA dehydrogenase family protein n=1 Tax=Methylosinus sp. H3A TaxID=2785786 RepID=UPI0018C3341C|nr:acyl-CoA dehydrogenase family protein [Methylosinus sp. H3A]MBG0810602.1 acyl-CoA dehydrogenase family protein [Methylosinus sp. H3A]